MNPINQGLTISLFGIGITFLVLILVILLIRLIVYLFPAKRTPRTAAVEQTSADPNIPHVVAFAAAWWLNQRKDPDLGRRLEEPPGRWWTQTHHQNQELS